MLSSPQYFAPWHVLCSLFWCILRLTKIQPRKTEVTKRNEKSIHLLGRFEEHKRLLRTEANFELSQFCIQHIQFAEKFLDNILQSKFVGAT